MPQDGKDEIEMVGVQAGHETAHTCSADLIRPAGSPQAGTGPSMSITSGTKSPGLVGGQVDTESEELFRGSSPYGIPGSPSAKRCLSK